MRSPAPKRAQGPGRHAGGHYRLPLCAGIAVGIALALALAACGQKGPLYLPNQKKTKVPASAPSTTATPGATTAAPATPH